MIEAVGMPPALLSRTLDEGWVANIKKDFRVSSMRPGQLLVDATEYKAEFPNKPLATLVDLQGAIDYHPDKFKMYPAAGRYVSRGLRVIWNSTAHCQVF